MTATPVEDGSVSEGLPSPIGGSIPESTFAPLLTYRDVYEHLLDVYHQDGKDVSTQRRRIRRSIVEAYNMLPALHDWEYFRRTGSITTDVAEILTGTYSASTKRITLSSGEWNASAQFGAVTIGSTRYPVKRRLSDTVVELRNGPSEDSTGEVCWERLRYLLPHNVGDIIDVADSNQWFTLNRVTINESFWWQEVVGVNFSPHSWSLISSPDYPGRWEIWLSGSGTNQRDIRYLYTVRHTGLPIEEVSSGTVSVSGDIATFSDDIVTDKFIGAVLRVGEDELAPTGEFGRTERNLVDGDYSDVYRPMAYERIIVEVNTDDNTAVLSVSSPTVSDRGFTVSSHIDVNYNGMRELFHRLAEEHYDINTRADAPLRRTSKFERMQAMKAAMISDGPGVWNRTNRGVYGSITIVEANDG